MITPRLHHEKTKAGFRVAIVSDLYGGHYFYGCGYHKVDQQQTLRAE